ncbi:MAG: hypothetical protein KZQ94_22335 [Candidatus Thiodiazotropha sp. (ex Troendleina suluensis)]|nr:hypothetical protein [Candidatus Thiodiazotropha sp. (ex Troendleina suluensis)]
MIRLILLTLLIFTSTFVNAGSKDHFYSIALSYVNSDLGKPEGILDNDSDQNSLLNNRTASGDDFRSTSTNRYGIKVTKGAFLKDTSHWLAERGIDVFGEAGLFIHPNYFVEADGRNEPSHLEMNLETFGGLALLGLKKGNFSLKGGLHISYTEAEVSYWRVDATAPNGHFESQKQVDDWSTGFVAEIEYNIFKDLFISYVHIDAIGSKNWIGISSADEISLKLRFK